LEYETKYQDYLPGGSKVRKIPVVAAESKDSKQKIIKSIELKCCPKCNGNLKKIIHAELRFDFEINRKNNIIMGDIIGAYYDCNPTIKCCSCVWEMTYAEVTFVAEQEEIDE
jgi:hypothetical protein